MKLDGAVAIVTGGSEGIGRAIAAALKAEGAEVTITARSQDRLQSAAGEIGVDWITADVGAEADAVRTVQSVVEKHGRLDILVNNAGIGSGGPLVDMELEELERVYRTNVFGAFLMAREAARQFVSQGSGELINVSSTSGLSGGPGATAYCWRHELRRHDIRVMLVNPSEVLTDFSSKLGRTQEQSPKKLRPEEIADAVVGALKIDNRGFIPEFAVFATNPF
jgi:3-oxoacyl-[acyl-carrier protein] reductase